MHENRPPAHAGETLAGLHGPLALLFDIGHWQAWLPRGRGLLDVHERARVARHHRPCDRDERTLAYACHRVALGHVLGLPPADVPLARDALGRPVVAGDPVQTSLSHAGGCVAVAISATGVVGIDLEPTRRAATMASIDTRILHADEARALAGLDAARRNRELLALWVRKEALLKAAGIGLAREMPDFVAPVGQPLPLPAADCGTQPGHAWVHMLDAGEDWCMAIACASPTAPLARWVDPPDV